MIKLLYFVIPLIITGCAVTGSTTFREMSTSYRDVLENYSNDNILINIVRASETLPLSFLDMPSVVGSGTITETGGISSTLIPTSPTGSVPQFFSAGAGSSYGPFANISISKNFNFTQSSLDNAAFMSSFLSDIKPESVANLNTNTAGSESLLYTLVIDKIEVKSKDGSIKKYINNPFSKDYKEFQDYLYNLIYAGLSTELVIQNQKLSPLMNSDYYQKTMLGISSTFNNPAVQIVTTKDKQGNDQFQLVKTIPQTRLCFTKKPSETLLDHRFHDSAYCSNDITGVNLSYGLKKEDKNNNLEVKTISIKLRSTRNVFVFLGQLLLLQNQNNQKIVKIKNSFLFQNDPGLLKRDAREDEEYPILVINKNNPGPTPVASVPYRGDLYSIPSTLDAGGSRMVLVLVAEMLSLNKVPGAIPPSPAVLVQ